MVIVVIAMITMATKICMATLVSLVAVRLLHDGNVSAVVTVTRFLMTLIVTVVALVTVAGVATRVRHV